MARLLAVVTWRAAGLSAAAAAVCLLGVLLVGRALQPLDDDAAPAQHDQQRLTGAVADLEAAAGTWALTGDPAARGDYATARGDVVDAAGELERHTVDAGLGARVEAAVADETAAVRRWVEDYGDVVVGAPPGTPSVAVSASGADLRARYVTSRERTQEALADQVADAGTAAATRLRLTAAAALLVLGVSLLVVARTRRRVVVELAEPLRELEQVVQRMLKNDPEGRADETRGPTEMRSIARALNDFADAGSRARAVEVRIQDELHTLDSAKDDFVSNVTHELRTPLTTISGYLEMVADEFEGRLDPRHARMLEATRRNVVRLRALIDDLLALSRLENRPTELEPSDVTAMVHDAVTDVRMTAARRGISVEVSAPDDPLLVVSDRAMLYRAFLNVLSNAVKFSEDDGVVEVTVRRVLTRVEVAVRDHGIGIPRAELDRLGTRFFRATNAMTNQIAGTGLGLRIVQTIIDKHAGDVVIESSEGVGTTVFVRLRLHGHRPPAPPPRGGDVPDGVPAEL